MGRIKKEIKAVHLFLARLKAFPSPYPSFVREVCANESLVRRKLVKA